MSQTTQLFQAVTELEDIGADVRPSPNGGYDITIDADLFNFMADAGAIKVGADGAIRLGGILVSIDVIAAGGTIGAVLTSPVTITVAAGVIAIGGVALWMARQAEELGSIRRQCEGLAHAKADRLGWIRYGKEWVQYYSECVRTRVWTK